jgi:uncharacterized protein YndB with AHSA1/START domain
MTMIDQRILIPASPDVVWELISDLASNPKWQVDCRSVSFLTSLRDEPGTRWRTTHANGHETVQEITVWYDRLGYEYKYVDGAPYREATGRIRLQEIAEGTVVQWTFTYEMPGVIGGLRNSLGTKRQIEAMMIDSLKGLWRHINQAGGSQQFREAKSLMRDALDYEQRAHYKPRHKMVGSGEERPEAPIAQAATKPLIPEPPISDEDTKPRPSVALPKNEPVEIPPVEPIPADPDFLFRPATLQPETPPPVQRPSVEIAAFQEPKLAEPVTPERVSSELDPQLTTAERRAILDTSEMDTAKVSIWEVFGLPRPSETQQMRAVQLQQEEQPTEEAAAPAVEAEETPVVIESEEVSSPWTLVDPPAAIPPADPLPEAVPVELITPSPPPVEVGAATTPVSVQVVKVPTAITHAGLRVVQRRKLVKLRRK